MTPTIIEYRHRNGEQVTDPCTDECGPVAVFRLVPCGTCGGKGTVPHPSQLWHAEPVPCPDCLKGWVPKHGQIIPPRKPGSDEAERVVIECGSVPVLVLPVEKEGTT